MHTAAIQAGMVEAALYVLSMHKGDAAACTGAGLLAELVADKEAWPRIHAKGDTHLRSDQHGVLRGALASASACWAWVCVAQAF